MSEDNSHEDPVSQFYKDNNIEGYRTPEEERALTAYDEALSAHGVYGANIDKYLQDEKEIKDAMNKKPFSELPRNLQDKVNALHTAQRNKNSKV